MHVALIEPNWNYTVQGKDWKNYIQERYLPLGLLKLGSLHRKKGNSVELLRRTALPSKKPDLILITSLFTYWWQPVWESVSRYKKLFPNKRIIVGGIYASIMPDHCKQSGCNEVYTGLVEDAEVLIPAYDLIPECDFCVIQTSRGCIRNCDFCYVHNLEPKFKPKRSIAHEIVKSNVSFLDNNLLANPYFNQISKELINSNVNSSYCLSGVDAELVTKENAKLMYEAHFHKIRIAFDKTDKESACERALMYFEEAGYSLKDIGVFVLYNFEDPFDEVEKRRILIKDWGAHIIKQRYVPIPSLTQYYLHPRWTEEECKQFAINCHNQLKD